MATRRFRVKAVANVSVSRGRCVEKPRESEKVDEKTSSNSSPTSDSQEVSSRETILVESISDTTLVEKLSNDNSSNETLENASVPDLVQNSVIVGEPTCSEVNGSVLCTPVDTPSVVSCDLTQENGTLENAPVPELDLNSANGSEATRLEGNGSDRSTPVDEPIVVSGHLAQLPVESGIQRRDDCGSKDVSVCNKADVDCTVSGGEHCIKTEENLDSASSGDSCTTSAQNIVTAATKVSSAPVRLPRKRMKPTVSLSLVNRKVKENPTVEIAQQCSASKIDDNSTVQIPKELQIIQTNSDLHKDIETGDSVRTVPTVCSVTPSTSILCDTPKKDDPVIVSQTSGEIPISQNNVSVLERENEVAHEVMSVDISLEVPHTGATSVTTPIHQSPVVSDLAAVGKDKRSSPSVKCSPLNSFRSRFIRPKPLLESAARRNRTSSIGSASESDSEKKSLSSATTVSPQWTPRLKTSRPRLTNVQTTETDKLANVSGASADESEDDRSSISGAPTISPPKKIARLDSDGGSDTSHSEFSQEVSEETTSSRKKLSTKPERVTKRKEYLRRIIEIKREISHKVSDGKVNKSRLTMFDLIYYNPVTNPMKSAQEPEVKKSLPTTTNETENEKRLAEESVDEPEAPEGEEQSSTVPVPQVKVGPNGEIILDEQSLVIETTDSKKNWNDLQNSEVIMDYGTGSTTFNAYSKKRKTRTKDWNREETLRFYRALHTVGTDFLVMQSLFPKFTRKELKDRYKKEERINRALVEKALRNPLTFDLTELQKEFEEERLEEERRLTEPKREKPKRKGGHRSRSLFAALDSTDTGEKRSEGKNIAKKPVKRKFDKHKELEETVSKKKRKIKSARALPECALDSDASNAMNGHVDSDASKVLNGHVNSDASNVLGEHIDSDATNAFDGHVDSDATKAVNRPVDSERSVTEIICSTSKVKPTRSGRIPRPRIFEDFMTDVEDICEETEITEICDRVTVEETCNSEPVGDVDPNEQEESISSDKAVAGEDSMVTYESENENDDQNFVIAEDALTVHQSQVNLGSVYSNVKPGTLIVLATESPNNPGHQIFRVFMVANNSQTVPVSVTNNQSSPAGNNSIEMGTSTEPVVSSSSTNVCNSPQISAESSS